MLIIFFIGAYTIFLFGMSTLHQIRQRVCNSMIQTFFSCFEGRKPLVSLQSTFETISLIFSNNLAEITSGTQTNSSKKSEQSAK